MEMNSFGSTILYLQLQIDLPQKKCLSAIDLDTTVTHSGSTLKYSNHIYVTSHNQI